MGCLDGQVLRKLADELAEYAAEEERKEKEAEQFWCSWPELCPCCDGDVVILTASGPVYTGYEGDDIRCVNCKCTGQLLVNHEDDAYVAWDENNPCGREVDDANDQEAV